MKSGCMAAVFDIVFCGRILRDRVLWQQCMRSGFVAVICEIGFFDSSL